MPERTGNFLTQVIPFIFAAFLAGLGGTVQYLNKIDKEGKPFKFFNFILEIFTSAFVGIVTFMLCDSAELDWQLTAGLVAISGHMGARLLFIFENVILISLLKKYGYDYSETKTQRKEKTNRNAKGSKEE